MLTFSPNQGEETLRDRTDSSGGIRAKSTPRCDLTLNHMLYSTLAHTARERTRVVKSPIQARVCVCVCVCECVCVCVCVALECL